MKAIIKQVTPKMMVDPTKSGFLPKLSRPKKKIKHMGVSTRVMKR